MIELLAGAQQNRESKNAILACNEWLRLGPGRTLPRLLERFIESKGESPPTRFLGTLRQWSARYNWEERAQEWDASAEERKNAAYREAMEEGLALDYERVSELKRLAGFLIEQTYEQGEGGVYHNVWLPDVKQIGSGDYAERVDIERFNAAMIDQLRGALDDLAKETGGRKTHTDITSDGKALTIVIEQRKAD